MNITWTVLNMRGVDVGAPLGTVITEVTVEVKAEENTALAVERCYVKVCKPKLAPDGTWYTPTVDPAQFIQYDTVTEQDVIAWVKDNLGFSRVGEIENRLSHQVERIINAPVIPKPVVLTPPWE
jgi:hypothetical protein